MLPYVYIKNNTTYISEQGETILKMEFSTANESIGAHTAAYDTTSVPHTEVHVTDIPVSHTDTLGAPPINTLIEMLQKELDVKNKQIEELTATVRIQAESINALNHNKLAETIMPRLESEKKGNFLSRLFSRNKR
jgi:hypothetical protein